MGASGPARRLRAAGSAFVETFIRDNRVLPPLLALLALAVFAWVVAGLFVGAPEEEPASNRSDLVQAEDPAEPADPPAPELENRDADSYAAYESKDPFRQLFSPAGENATGETTGVPGGGTTTGVRKGARAGRGGPADGARGLPHCGPRGQGAP